MNSRKFIRQKIAGTGLDSQNERLSLDDLQCFVEYCRGRRIPLHQQHAMGEPVTGHIENVFLAQDDTMDGEWAVFGDVTADSEAFDRGMRGFSISFVAPLVDRPAADCLVYISHSLYTDQAFVEYLASDPNLRIGRWVRKAAEGSGFVLFGAAIAFALTPVWDHLYKSRVAPVIDQFLDQHFSALSARKVTTECIQLVLWEGHQIELRFVPESGKERWCLSSECVSRGITIAACRLLNNARAKEVGVQRIILKYAVSERAYEVLRIEYKDGVVE